MIRIRDTRYPSTAALLTEAIGIAQYYGFRSLDEMPRLSKPHVVSDKIKVPTLAEIESLISFARKDERLLLSVARKSLYVARSQPNEPLLLWRLTQGTSAVPSLSLELHSVGTQSAIAEALLIVVANAIAEKIGLQHRALSINNMGSAESSSRFMRDVGTYLRKHIDSISPTLRPRAAQDPLATLVQLIERGHPAAPRAPQSMEYLSEEERRRFWEFLEYLEVMGLPYELNGRILGSRDVWAHTLYEISTLDPETNTRVPIAFGGRYDPIMSRFAKTPSFGAVMTINFESRGTGKPKPVNISRPGIFFAHLGAEARRKALMVLEQLRRADIPVHQSLLSERLGDQMAAAKALAVPYILIMGHKEVMENAVLVREVATNSQDTVPVDELASYLKRRRPVLARMEARV